MDEYDLAGMCEERRNCTFLFEGRQECDENKITCASIGTYFQKILSTKKLDLSPTSENVVNIDVDVGNQTLEIISKLIKR